MIEICLTKEKALMIIRCDVPFVKGGNHRIYRIKQSLKIIKAHVTCLDGSLYDYRVEGMDFGLFYNETDNSFWRTEYSIYPEKDCETSYSLQSAIDRMETVKEPA